VTSGQRKGRRAFFYACTGYHKRGTSVCGDGLILPIERVDQAVLGALGGEVLREEVVQQVIDSVLVELNPQARNRRPTNCCGVPNPPYRNKLVTQFVDKLAEQGKLLRELPTPHCLACGDSGWVEDANTPPKQMIMARPNPNNRTAAEFAPSRAMYRWRGVIVSDSGVWKYSRGNRGRHCRKGHD
jgi:hypothetical protein